MELYRVPSSFICVSCVSLSVLFIWISSYLYHCLYVKHIRKTIGTDQVTFLGFILVAV